MLRRPYSLLGTDMVYGTRVFFVQDVFDTTCTDLTETAEAQVRQWRHEGRLPFPNFSTEQIQRMRGSVAYPPPGSPDASNAGSKTNTEEG